MPQTIGDQSNSAMWRQHLQGQNYRLAQMEGTKAPLGSLVIVTEEVDASTTTSSTTYVSAPDGNGPSLTVTVGASGQLLVLASCFMEPGGNDQTCFAGVYVNGTLLNNYDTLAVGANGTPIAVNAASARHVTGLPPTSSVTVELKYRVSASAPGAGTFGGRTLTCWPL